MAGCCSDEWWLGKHFKIFSLSFSLHLCMCLFFSFWKPFYLSPKPSPFHLFLIICPLLYSFSSPPIPPPQTVKQWFLSRGTWTSGCTFAVARGYVDELLNSSATFKKWNNNTRFRSLVLKSLRWFLNPTEQKVTWHSCCLEYVVTELFDLDVAFPGSVQQGTFMECRPYGSISHRFHRNCASILKDSRFCPHCGEDASGAKEVTVLKPDQSPSVPRSNHRLSLPAVPTLATLPSGPTRPAVPQVLRAKKTSEPQRSRDESPSR